MRRSFVQAAFAGETSRARAMAIRARAVRANPASPSPPRLEGGFRRRAGPGACRSPEVARQHSGALRPVAVAPAHASLFQAGESPCCGRTIFPTFIFFPSRTSRKFIPTARIPPQGFRHLPDGFPGRPGRVHSALPCGCDPDVSRRVPHANKCGGAPDRPDPW